MQVYKNKKDCCGCTACYNACGVNAIEMKADEKGFLYPVVNQAKCVNCGKCKNVCPFSESYKINKTEPDIYAFKNKDDDVREESSSGGVFQAIAQYIILKDGIVVGVETDDKFIVKHSVADNMDDVKKFSGSKYVQSDLGRVFADIRKFLENGRYVLFSGTPCQVAGLKSYLGKDYETLYTVDFICHGVPSPLMWKHFIDGIKKQYEGIEAVVCRDTAKWGTHITKVILRDGIVKHTDDYIQMFLSNCAIRKSCFECKFTSCDRVGDFTMADYWGLKNCFPEFYDTKGASVLFFNTDKSKKLFDVLNEAGHMIKSDITKVLPYQPQLVSPIRKTRICTTFWKDYKKRGYEFVFKKYIIKKHGRRLKFAVARYISKIRKGIRR